MRSKIGRRWSLWVLSWLLSYPLVLHMSLTNAIAAPIKFKLPPPPPRGITGHRSAAASRDPACPVVAQPLTALVPEYRDPQGDRVWGLTAMARPTLWFYVPYAKNAIVDMSFTLQDESNPADTKIIYQNLKIAPDPIPGMLQITLPKSIESLATNKSYHWFLTLNMTCTIGQRPFFVDGWIQRVAMQTDLSQEIERSTPIKRVALYAKNGLWYDAIAALATLRSANPQDPELLQDWQNLLDAIGLKSLADRV
jgi:hypothetical protein